MWMTDDSWGGRKYKVVPGKRKDNKKQWTPRISDSPKEGPLWLATRSARTRQSGSKEFVGYSAGRQRRAKKCQKAQLAFSVYKDKALASLWFWFVNLGWNGNRMKAPPQLSTRQQAAILRSTMTGCTKYQLRYSCPSILAAAGISSPP